MDIAALLLDMYGRIPPLVAGAVDGLNRDELAWTPEPTANSIGWLCWHLTRVQDHHVSELLEEEQFWTGGDWAAHFGLAPDPHNTGYGHGPHEVSSVRPDSPEALLSYLAEVDKRTRRMVGELCPDDLDRIVDRRWDPPVTMGVRLVSVADDCLQHVGQATYVRGLLPRS